MTSVTSPSDTQLFGLQEGEKAAGRNREMAILVVAILLSLALLWFATRNIAMVGGFGAAIMALTAVSYFVARSRPQEQQVLSIMPPDWSVTRDAAALSHAAVAISDRAGRLLCANGLFAQWFGGKQAPPNIPMNEGSVAIMVDLARDAWRDGEASASGLAAAEREFAIRVLRSGVGDEYLLWWISPSERVDIETRARDMISGRIGRAMTSSGIMASTINSDGRITAVNSAFALRASGGDNSNLTGGQIAELLKMDENGAVQFTHEGRAGLPVRLIHVPLLAEQPEGAAMLLAIDEDGVRIDRQSALAHVQNMLETLPLGLALVDRDGRFLFANESFSRMVGIKAAALPPYPGDLVVADDKSALSESVRRFTRGQAMAGDIAVRLKDAPDEVVAMSVAGVRGLGDAAVLIGLKDNSEETRLKRQVAQASKMQSIGQLAGGVAHDFNNILTAIIGYCDLMLLRHQPGDSDYDDIQQIRTNSNRAASLTRQLLAFSRQQTLRPQILQLPDVVVEASSLLKRLLGEKVRLELSHGRGIGPVRADPGQLEQVIINLGVNARDAMPDGGVVVMRTQPITKAEVTAMRSDILPVDDYVLLCVEDSGTGISRENLTKIFEPFFTTKEVGKGTGLGLSTVYGIVKQSGGFIFADSELGKGTRFDVYLPLYRGEMPDKQAQAKKEQKAAPTWGNGKLLIVEDEDMVRAVAERALTRQGYVVETARDGEEALELFAEGKRYDMIVSDVVMPNLDGPGMARKLRAQYGDMRILFMSGYAEEQLRESINLDNVWFLAKPFSVQQIAESVRDVLAS